MREVRLAGRPPAVYLVLAVVCTLVAVVIATTAWFVAVAGGALAAVFVILAVRAASARFALHLEPEPALELGSVFGRTRVPLSGIAAVRRRGVNGGRGPSYDVWEAIGADGAILARGVDVGLDHEGLRSLETELRLWRVPLERG